MATITLAVRIAAAVGQLEHERRSVGVADPPAAAHEDERRAERPRLVERVERQLPAADATREPRVVADERAGAGLAADGLLLDDQRPQAFGRGRDRGGQAAPARRR